MKAIGYVRVSTEEQAREGVSLDAQEERLRAYCAMQGLELVEVVREAGVSGSVVLTDRPAGGGLIAAVRGKRVEHVVALKLDRLFRDAVDALTQTREWDRAGIALHLVDMGGQSLNSASAMGRLFLTVLAGLAECERNLIAERTRTAMRHKAARGEVVGRAPRGLRIEGKGVVADEASDGLTMYRRARTMRDAGLTYRAIAEQLTREGFRPQRRDAGDAIAAATVRYLLNNPRMAAAA